MNRELFTIRDNLALTDTVYEMRLRGDTSAIRAPGQFVNIELPGFYLRRPISVCDWTAGELTILYKTVGRGTEYMKTLAEGAQLELLLGLGNGYDTSKSGGEPLLIGGGVGIPPLFALAKQLLQEGKTPTVILGFRTAAEVFYQEEFAALGVKLLITTEDGSLGIQGFVTDAMEGLSPSYLYSCGPLPMLRAVYEASACDGQFSFEERMGCGFGACMGCSCETKDGYKRICKEGPVLERGEIVW